MKLYLVHCGFYDPDLSEGIYEPHMNLFVAAKDFDDAKSEVRKLPEFKERKMHIDGMQEFEAVNGFRINLTEDSELKGRTILHSNRHRDL